MDPDGYLSVRQSKSGLSWANAFTWLIEPPFNYMINPILKEEIRITEIKNRTPNNESNLILNRHKRRY